MFKKVKEAETSPQRKNPVGKPYFLDRVAKDILCDTVTTAEQSHFPAVGIESRFVAPFFTPPCLNETEQLLCPVLSGGRMHFLHTRTAAENLKRVKSSASE